MTAGDRLLLHARQVEPHLGLPRDAPGHGERQGLIRQPLLLERVRELLGIGRAVLEQRAAVVAQEDVLMAFRNLQGGGEKGSMSGFGVLGRVLQAQQLGGVVPVRRLILLGPARARTFSPGVQACSPCGPDFVLQFDPLWLSQVIEAMAGLRRRLPLAVGLAGLWSIVTGPQQMALPGAVAVVAAALVHARVEAALQLREDVGVAQRLQPSKLLLRLSLRRGSAAPAPCHLHLVEDPDMVGEAGLPRRHCLEDLRVAALALHVNEGRVPSLKVQRREGFSLEDKPERDVLARVLASANAAPECTFEDAE